MGQSSLLPNFVNKVLPEQASLIHLCIVCGYLCAMTEFSCRETIKHKIFTDTF
jgi:hypothetical protein